MNPEQSSDGDRGTTGLATGGPERSSRLPGRGLAIAECLAHWNIEYWESTIDSLSTSDATSIVYTPGP